MPTTTTTMEEAATSVVAESSAVAESWEAADSSEAEPDTWDPKSSADELSVGLATETGEAAEFWAVAPMAAESGITTIVNNDHEYHKRKTTNLCIVISFSFERDS